MIVGQRNNHDGADLDLAVDSDGLLVDGVQAKDGGLGKVDDGGSVQRAAATLDSESDQASENLPEDTTVGDGEGTTSHVLDGQLVVAGLLAKLGNGALNPDHVKGLSVAHNGSNKTLFRCDGDGDIHVIAVDNGVVVLDGSVDGRNILHGLNDSTREGAHEPELDAGLLHHGLLVEFAHVHKSRHIDLVEGGQRGGAVLGLLEALGDAETHAVHFHLLLSAKAFAAHDGETYTILFAVAEALVSAR